MIKSHTPAGNADQGSKSGKPRATLFIVVAALGSSLYPLTIGLSNGRSNPALALILFLIGTIIVMSVLLIFFVKSKKRDEKHYISFGDISDFVRDNRNFLLDATPEDTSDSDAPRGQKQNENDSPGDREDDEEGGKDSGNPNIFGRFWNSLNGFWNRYALLLVIIGGFDLLFFAWSINYLDVALASIFAEFWAVGFVLLRYFNRRKTKDDLEKDDLLSPSIWALFVFALFGVIYVTLSHNSINPSFDFSGLMLVTAFIVLCSIKVERSLHWAEEMEKKWKEPKNTRVSEEQKNNTDAKWSLMFIFVGIIIAHIITIILVIIGRMTLVALGSYWYLTFTPNQTGLFVDEAGWLTGWLICIAGGLAFGIGMWGFREGNLITQTLDVNGIYYLTPVLAVLWLIPFGLAQLEQWDYFIIGALIIVATSVLIGVETETQRKGFRWLIVSLWSTGVLVYFREEWIQLPWLADGTAWEWGVETVDYYSLIVLSATIFILILSFRISRLVERTNKEEDQYIRMKHVLNKMADLSSNQHTKTINDIDKSLDKLDKSNTMAIGKLQNEFPRQIKNIRGLRSVGIESQESVEQEESEHKEPVRSEHKELKQMSYDLELGFYLLTRSKQRGRYLAENLVLYIFAAVTIMVTIGTRPAVTSPWNALLIDVLAFLFSSAICFMTINLMDLRLYRERSTLELMKLESDIEEDDDDPKRKDDDINQKAVQVISIILAIVVSLSFVVLLYDKWMGVWFI